jgi:hypothetical protein
MCGDAVTRRRDDGISTVFAADANYLRDAVVVGVSDVYGNLTFTLDEAPPKSTRMFISQNRAQRTSTHGFTASTR